MITEDRQFQAMDGNLQSSGLKTVVSGHFEPTFYKNVNLEDMLIYFRQLEDLIKTCSKPCNIFSQI